MSELSERQAATVEVLVALVGLSGVHRRPRQGPDIVLDLLPASHVLPTAKPFCVRVPPDGSLHAVSDEEAGIEQRPGPLEAMP